MFVLWVICHVVCKWTLSISTCFYLSIYLFSLLCFPFPSLPCHDVLMRALSLSTPVLVNYLSTCFPFLVFLSLPFPVVWGWTLSISISLLICLSTSFPFPFFPFNVVFKRATSVSTSLLICLSFCYLLSSVHHYQDGHRGGGGCPDRDDSVVSLLRH